MTLKTSVRVWVDKLQCVDLLVQYTYEVSVCVLTAKGLPKMHTGTGTTVQPKVEVHPGKLQYRGMLGCTYTSRLCGSICA